jgi:hypothetical protein
MNLLTMRPCPYISLLQKVLSMGQENMSWGGCRDTSWILSKLGFSGRQSKLLIPLLIVIRNQVLHQLFHCIPKCLNSTAQIGQENSLPDYMVSIYLCGVSLNYKNIDEVLILFNIFNFR